MIYGSFNFCSFLLFGIVNHPVPLAFLLMKGDHKWDTPWQKVVRVLGREHMAFHPVWETGRTGTDHPADPVSCFFPGPGAAF